jgi:hypothetical protein
MTDHTTPITTGRPQMHPSWQPLAIYRGFLVEQASGGHWLARDPWTAAILTHHGTSMVCRYPSEAACKAAIDHRVDAGLGRAIGAPRRNLSLYG